MKMTDRTPDRKIRSSVGPLCTPDPRRDPALWPKRGDGGATRDGWDALCDGPMPEDGDRAWELWDAAKAAGDGPEADADWDRYEAHMKGPCGPVHIGEPITDLLRGMLAGEITTDPDSWRIPVLEELIEYDEEDAAQWIQESA